MKVLFAGPSLFHADPDLPDIELRGPAAHGDIAAAVKQGANIIGLIDGQFETVASVWHKEILFALSEGVRVLGAASMGALRAAECEPYGMEPIGTIANRYASGELSDDAAVAQAHAPAELNYMPLTETLVDAEATILRLKTLNLISEQEAVSLNVSADTIFFKERTAKTIVDRASQIPMERRDAILGAYSEHHHNLKTEDALLLVDTLRGSENERVQGISIEPNQPRVWQRILDRIN